MEQFKITIENEHDGDYSLNEDQWLCWTPLRANTEHTLFQSTAETLQDALLTVQTFYTYALAYLESDKLHIKARLVTEWSEQLITLTEILQQRCIYAQDGEEFDNSDLYGEWRTGNQFGSWVIQEIPTTIQLTIDRTKEHQIIVENGKRFTITSEDV